MNAASHPLETTRLRLEPVRAEHAALVYDQFTDEELWEFFPELRPKNREELHAMYARWERGNQDPELHEFWENWIVFERESDQATGQLQAIVLPDGAAYLAFIFYKRFHGKGFAREAAAAAVAHLQAQHGVVKLLLEFDTKNEHARKLAEALGFTLVEERRNVDRRYGLFGDEFVYERIL